MGKEIADIIRDHLGHIKINSHQYKILKKIENCQTGILGFHTLECSSQECENEIIVRNACKCGSCPKCMGLKQLQWAYKRDNEILPVNYDHAVFRSPSCYNELFKYNQKDCYNIFFQSVSETFKALIPRTKFNKPLYGYLAILHTWSQLIDYRVHIHCLIPEGQFNVAKNRWENSNNKILNKEILSTTFKKILSKKLIKYIKKNKIVYPGITEEYILKKSKKTRSLVYIKKSIRNVTDVIKYFSKYTSKIAITNDRIVDYDGETVTISYVDRANGNKIRTKDMNAVVFLNRFVSHILPYKLPKIRYYGFMANVCKKKYLKICKDLLKKAGKEISKKDQATIKYLDELLKKISENNICTVCHKGVMVMKKGSFIRYGP